ncbi:MAG: hypothetical protein U1F09_15605 [Steroidobacteraceae bacterium]
MLELGGLRTALVEPSVKPDCTVVLMHGYAMTPDDLVPFARSLRLPVRFVFPEGPLPAVPSGRAWWTIDEERRAAALQHGPRDLRDEYPPGRAEARARLGAMLTELGRQARGAPVVIGGFSQGAMLACDHLFMDDARIAGLIAMSASRIAIDDWTPAMARVAGLPAFVSHGRDDQDLAFEAGEGLRDALAAAGAGVTWVPFDGGHGIPLVVWRELRKFLRRYGPSDDVGT